MGQAMCQVPGLFHLILSTPYEVRSIPILKVKKLQLRV